MRIPLIALSMLFVFGVHAHAFEVKGTAGSRLQATVVAEFDGPWAMTFLPGGQLLVTTKPGKFWLVTSDGTKVPVTGLPKPVVGGQGGLGDVIIDPDFEKNQFIYVSMVRSNDGGKSRGAVVYRAKLNIDGMPNVSDVTVFWEQKPHRRGKGHFSHRIAIGPKGSAHEGKIFITSGDRQEQSPAQRWDMALGKIIRLNLDGSVPSDNPFQDKGKLAKTFWSTGHRNPLGIAFDGDNRLWSNEMGPRHGDELNLITPGTNYGWPVVSEGKHYGGLNIPNHDTRPEFAPPKAFWVPSIAPSGLVIYDGQMFPQWKGNAFIGGLVSRALVRVKLTSTTASEAERFKWGKRIREVEQGPDGAIWVLEDRAGGRLVRLSK